MKLNESRSEPSDLEDGLQRVRDCGYVASLSPAQRKRLRKPTCTAMSYSETKEIEAVNVRALTVDLAVQPCRKTARKPSCSKCRSLVSTSVSPSRRMISIEMQSVRL